MREIIEIDTKDFAQTRPEADIYEIRSVRAGYDSRECKSEVTILVTGYKNLEKTKACVESILKYTKGVDYELWLVDNGSPDETFEYFKTVDYDKLHILRLTEGRGIGVPDLYFSPSMIGKYFVGLANDLVVTENWLTNLLAVAKSDPRIGMVTPVSSNVSNRQRVDLNFSSEDEMQEKAAAFNVSDPRKWEERLRMVTIGSLYTKECILAIGLPITDVGFIHNFSDDDISFRVRRAGYKAVLACDTWIHHNDVKVFNSEEDQKRYLAGMAQGREEFKDKYFGIDAWDDVMNFIPECVDRLKPVNGRQVNILGVDVKCGTPVLELKNGYRKQGNFDAACSAYTTDAKYMVDLMSICGPENAFSGAIDGFQENFRPESFDSVIINRDINTYADPFKVIKAAYGLLKQEGQLFISLKNTFNAFSLFKLIGRQVAEDKEVALDYTIDEFLVELSQKGYKFEYISSRFFRKDVLTDDVKGISEKILNMIGVRDINEKMYRLSSERYFILITK